MSLRLAIANENTEQTEVHGEPLASVKSSCPPCLRGEAGRLAAG